jgi:hypothetical protein
MANIWHVSRGTIFPLNEIYFLSDICNIPISISKTGVGECSCHALMGLFSIILVRIRLLLFFIHLIGEQPVEYFCTPDYAGVKYIPEGN